MKNTFILLALLLLIACNSSDAPAKKKQYSLQERIDIKIKDELAKGIANDTVILSHRFGMSKKEVYQHKNKLMKAKRIYGIFKTKNTRIFVYDIKTRNFEKLTFYFDAFFHDDEMYSMECKPKIEKIADVPLIQKDIIELFESKYGRPDFMVPVDTIKNYETALWIDYNQKIEISRDEEEVMVAYTDLIRSRNVIKDF